MRVQCASLVLLSIGRGCWFHRTPGFPQVALKVTTHAVFFAMWPEPKTADGSSARHALFLKLFLLFGRSEAFCGMTFHVSESQVLPSIVFTGMCLSKENLTLESFRRSHCTYMCLLSECMHERVRNGCLQLFVPSEGKCSEFLSLSFSESWRGMVIGV